MNRKYYTVTELLEAALAQAKKDPQYQEALRDCVLDYELPSHSVRYDRLTKCKFNVIGVIKYGGSEGIYAKGWNSPARTQNTGN